MDLVIGRVPCEYAREDGADSEIDGEVAKLYLCRFEDYPRFIRGVLGDKIAYSAERSFSINPPMKHPENPRLYANCVEVRLVAKVVTETWPGREYERTIPMAIITVKFSEPSFSPSFN